MTQVDEIWEKLLISAKNDIKPQTFETWFKPIQPIGIDQGKIDLSVPNMFFKNWIQEHYLDYIHKNLKVIMNKEVMISFNIDEKQKSTLNTPVKAPRIPRRNTPLAKSHFQEKYAFKNFIVGPSNRLAYAAASAVAEKPASTYNPFFIYGCSGLGKTHLLQAIGISVLEKFPNYKVVYISCEEFTNQLINSIQNRNTLKFRNRYRTIDLLLIDDIHFLSGKEQTQEEFFHTFNTLHDSGKQIVLSSDKPPKEIKNLEERLISRFEWGLVTDIQIPNYETRLAILLQKSENLKIALPQNVREFLAENIKSNIRKLEGALIKLTSYSSLTARPIQIDIAKELLHDIMAGEKYISIEHIQKKVAEHYDIRLADMTSKKRPKAISFPRQVAMFLCKELTNLSLNEIGEGFGGRDHTTVMHAINVIETERKKDFSLQSTISSIKQKINS